MSNTIAESDKQSSTSLVLFKLFTILAITTITLAFGFAPIFCTIFSKNSRFIALANAFSGGIFIGIAFFHLIPESMEAFQQFFGENSTSIFAKIPLTFFISFASYSMILFIEKVAFDSHLLIDHDHGGNNTAEGEHAHIQAQKAHNRNLSEINEREEYLNQLSNLQENLATTRSEVPLLKKKSEDAFNPFETYQRLRSFRSEKGLDKLLTFSFHDKIPYVVPDNLSVRGDALSSAIYNKPGISPYMDVLESRPDTDDDEDEETIKNVITSRGKLASFLHFRKLEETKLRKSIRGIPSDDEVEQINKPLYKASILLGTYNNPTVVGENSGAIALGEDFTNYTGNTSKKSNFTPYILMMALSLHGFFEGIALGIQPDFDGTMFLFFAVLSHKWAEAFTLGNSFNKANTDRETYSRLIFVFTVFTPLGIFLGLFFVQAHLFKPILLSVSGGTFIYISCSEIIVEEFAMSKYKYKKFFFFILGASLIAWLSILEASKGMHKDL